MKSRSLWEALVSIAFLVACGGSKPAAKAPEPKPDPIPATAGPDCKTVADHLVTVVLADKPDTHAKAATKLAARCTDDKWTDEVRSCFGTANDTGEVDGCAGKLPAAQHDGFTKLTIADVDAAAPTSAMQPAPAPPAEEGKAGRKTRGAVPKPKASKPKGGADPCQGGEADPCQGGQ